MCTTGKPFSARCRILWGTSKQPMKLQQPRNYDFEVSQLNLLRSPSGNDRDMLTSPPGHHWEAVVVLTTTAKLQQLRANNRETTTFCRILQQPQDAMTVKRRVRTEQSLQHVHEIPRCFMAVVGSSAFRKSSILSKHVNTWTRIPATTQFQVKNGLPKSFCNFSALDEVQPVSRIGGVREAPGFWS